MTNPASSDSARTRALFTALGRAGRLRVDPVREHATTGVHHAGPPLPAAMAPLAAVLPRGDRLTRILRSLCLRGGFSQAAVADTSGLALADSGGSFLPDVLAAFAGVAATALEQAGKRLERPAANNFSLDVDDVDRVVARGFGSVSGSFLLLVVGAQDTDVRAEIELSIEEIIAVLDEANLRRAEEIP
jgi:hypothetical protein